MADYVDLHDIQNPADDEDILTAWGDQVRENDEFLYGRKDGCKASKSQTITDITETAIDFGSGSIEYDTTPSMIDGTRLEIPRSGLWTFTAFSVWANSDIGERQGKFKLNGNEGFMTTVHHAPTPGTGQCGYTHTEPDRYYAAADYVEYLVNHSIGTSAGVVVTLSARWLSP